MTVTHPLLTCLFSPQLRHHIHHRLSTNGGSNHFSTFTHSIHFLFSSQASWADQRLAGVLYTNDHWKGEFCGLCLEFSMCFLVSHSGLGATGMQVSWPRPFRADVLSVLCWMSAPSDEWLSSEQSPVRFFWQWSSTWWPSNMSHIDLCFMHLSEDCPEFMLSGWWVMHGPRPILPAS